MSNNETPFDDRALIWLALLLGQPQSPTLQQDFALWLAASPRNKTYFDAALAMWEDLAVLALTPSEHTQV